MHLCILSYFDHIQWIMTPDWIMSFIPKALLCKYKPNTFSNAHLRIKPVTVAENIKQEEDDKEKGENTIVKEDDKRTQNIIISDESL